MQKHLILLLLAIRGFSDTLGLIELPNATTTNANIGLSFTPNDVAASPDGTIYFGGDYNSGEPLVWKYNGSTMSLLTNPVTGDGAINAIAVDSNGTAYFGGDYTGGPPLFWKYNGSVLSELTISNTDHGIITSVGVDANGTVYFAGQNDTASPQIPLIYQYNGSALLLLTNPNTGPGLIQSLAIDHDGTVYFGGESMTGEPPIAWKYNGTSITLLTNPNTDDGYIYAVCVTPDGTAYFGGETSLGLLLWQYNGTHMTALTSASTNLALVYDIDAAADGTVYFTGVQGNVTPEPLAGKYADDTVTYFPNPVTGSGSFSSLAIASDGSVYFAGSSPYPSSSNPTVWVYNGSSLAVLMSPNTDLGEIRAAAAALVGGAAYFGGHDSTMTMPFVYKTFLFPSTSTHLPTYDIDRLRNIYEELVEETRERLEESGL